MAENIQRTRGRPGNYRLDKGGYPTESGPFIGEVMNNHDPARIGRVQVYIPEFGSNDKSDSSTWRTVRYLSPFFGATYVDKSKETSGAGQSIGNSHSYGMWFTVPDVGVQVLCFFVNGDANQGYYVGSIPDPDLMHMIPAIGASSNYQLDPNNSEQARKLSNASRLPVTEINAQSKEIREDARSFDQARPVHSIVAATMYQQGVINDRVRGPIGSTSLRESPSAVFGISTPGRPIYESGISEYNIAQSIQSGGITDKDIKIIGRRGGHSIVLDDGDQTGNDNLVRIRTSKGHQITMSDDGNTVHIMHANGQAWIELGKEGTVDVYAANSINLRAQGSLNLHADEDVNIYAGRTLNLHGKKATLIESQETTSIIGEKNLTMFSNSKITVKSNGTLAVAGEKAASVSASGPLALNGAFVGLNTFPSLPAGLPLYTTRTKLPDTKHTTSGWSSTDGSLDSIATRAPTHEPYAHHNKGVPTNVAYDSGGSADAGNDEVIAKMNQIADIGVRKE